MTVLLSKISVATWQWYAEMDAVLQGLHSISPPLVVAANVSGTASGIVPSSSSAPPPGMRMRPRKSRSSSELLREQAKRNIERESQAACKEEERGGCNREREQSVFMLFLKN